MALTQVDGGLLSPTNGQYTGFKSRIINGDMRIDQRNAGASVTPTSTTGLTYSLDRFATYGSQASKFSVQQNAGSVTAPAGFINYLGITSLSAYSITSTDTFALYHRIEGFNTADLGWGTANAKTVTLSFWVRSSLTGTFGGSFRNDGSTRSYPYSYTISAANTWEYKTITIAGDTSGTWQTNNGLGIDVIFGFGVGSSNSGTAGSWYSADYRSATGATSVVGTNGATFYITGVQLEKGSTATSFDYRPYGTELALCQRYYENVGIAASGDIVIGGYSGGSSYAYLSFPFAAVKRSAPTVTKNGTWAGARSNQPGVAETSTWGFRCYAQANTSGDFYVQNTGSGTNFTASAEL